MLSIIVCLLFLVVPVVGSKGAGGASGEGGGESGGGNRGNCGTGRQASISKPTPFIYLVFEKNRPIQIRLSEMLIYSYTALCFFYPFIAGS